MEWDWEFIAPMLLGMTFFLPVAGVLVFRPLTKRLGDLIEITTRNRQMQGNQDDLARLTDVVGRLADRVDQLEERQDFTERVLTSVNREGRARIPSESDR